ncbi:MAG: adenine-specific DNA-methyltransferase [Anaerolineae bacterium]|nr:adenine-specific DNA-methyltransferase [Anaerolineae bacterium]
MKTFQALFKTMPAVYEANHQALAICDDALDVLRAINSNSIHLIFADPPYNLGKDFGNGRTKMPDSDYVQWCQEWLTECHRILHPNGTLYFMAATQYMPSLDVFVSEHYHVLSRIIWTYDSSGVQPRRQFGSLYEPIVMIVKNPNQYTFNAEAIKIEAKTGAQRKLIDYRKSPPQPYNTQKLPANVWDFPRVRYRMPEYENHPSQKPETLLERIILASSHEGDFVLDPFGGSFTTGAVAVKNNRLALSADINPEYFKIGLRRMSICTKYEGAILERDLVRKTKNKSKKDHANRKPLFD